MFLRLVQQQSRTRLYNIIEQALTLTFQGILTLLQRLQKIVSLKSKLSSFLLYLMSSIYIFIKFINSLPKPQLNKVGYINKIGYTNKVGYTNEIGYTNKIDYTDRVGYIGKVGYRISKVKVKVLVVLVLVLVLAKLFLRRQLIYSKLNFPLAIIYFLISNSVHFIGSSSYRVLNSNLKTVVFLYFLTLYAVGLQEYLQLFNIYLVAVLKNLYCKVLEIFLIGFLQLIIFKVIDFIF